MDEERYSVYFTGRFLVPLDETAVRQRLHALFPHADEAHLAPFIAGRRVRLVHGETLEDAQTIARALMVHDLDTDIVTDRGARADQKPLASTSTQSDLVRERILAIGSGECPPLAPDIRHEGDEDRLTPRGQIVFWSFIFILLFVTGVASVAALHNRPLAGMRGAVAADMPSACVSQARSSYLGRVLGYELICAGDSSQGQYRLIVRCALDDGDTSVEISSFDPEGQPRAPAWRVRSDGPAALPVSYASDAGRDSLWLYESDQAHLGVLEAIPQMRLQSMLASPRMTISGLFPGESAVFDLDAARWYVDYFSGECGFSKVESR